MVFPVNRALRFQFFTVSLVFLVLIPLCVVIAQSETDYTGTGRQNRITGRLSFPSGRRVDSNPVRVTLESTSSEKLTVVTNSGGFLEQLRVALVRYPKFPLTLNELGVQYLKLKQPDKAAVKLREAVQLTPEDFTPRLNYNIALLEKRDKVDETEQEMLRSLELSSAEVSFETYLKMSPKTPDANKIRETIKELRCKNN